MYIVHSCQGKEAFFIEERVSFILLCSMEDTYERRESAPWGLGLVSQLSPRRAADGSLLAAGWVAVIVVVVGSSSSSTICKCN
jgi:hypothetical protein